MNNILKLKFKMFSETLKMPQKVELNKKEKIIKMNKKL